MEEHIQFLQSKPYEAWYFIGEEPLGAIYLTRQNEIGIFIFRKHQGKGYGEKAIKSLIAKHGERRYLANINPNNSKSIKLFDNLGFKLISQTYELM